MGNRASRMLDDVPAADIPSLVNHPTLYRSSHCDASAGMKAIKPGLARSSSRQLDAFIVRTLQWSPARARLLPLSNVNVTAVNDQPAIEPQLSLSIPCSLPQPAMEQSILPDDSASVQQSIDDQPLSSSPTLTTSPSRRQEKKRLQCAMLQKRAEDKARLQKCDSAVDSDTMFEQILEAKDRVVSRKERRLRFLNTLRASYLLHAESVGILGTANDTSITLPPLSISNDPCSTFAPTDCIACLMHQQDAPTLCMCIYCEYEMIYSPRKPRKVKSAALREKHKLTILRLYDEQQLQTENSCSTLSDTSDLLEVTTLKKNKNNKNKNKKRRQNQLNSPCDTTIISSNTTLVKSEPTTIIPPSPTSIQNNINPSVISCPPPLLRRSLTLTKGHLGIGASLNMDYYFNGNIVSTGSPAIVDAFSKARRTIVGHEKNIS